MRSMVSAGLMLALGLAAMPASADELTDRGFTVVKLSPAQRNALLDKKAPAHKFVKVSKGGKNKWVYFDPNACHCLYQGNDEQFSSYKEKSWGNRVQDGDFIHDSRIEDTLYDDYVNW